MRSLTRTLILLAVAVPALAAPARLPVETLRKLCASDWYVLSVLGKPAGYTFHKLSLVTAGPRTYLEEIERAIVHITVGGPALPIQTEQVTRFDDTLKPFYYRLSENDMGRTKTTEATLQDDGLRVTVTTNDTHETQILPVGPDYGSDLQLAAELMLGKLKRGDQRLIQVFRPDVGILDMETATVAEVPAAPEGEYVVRTKSGGIGVEAVSHIRPDGTLTRQEVPAMLQLTMVRVTEAEAMAAAMSPLKITNSIPAEGPPIDPFRLTDLILIARDKAFPPATYLPVSPRQEVLDQPDRSALIHIHRPAVPAVAAQLPITAPAVALYLQPTETAQSDNPEIIKTARTIVADEKDAWRAAQKLSDWVFRHMTKVASQPQPVTALEVLHSMTGDCTEHAILLATLARAVGLPSQFVTGVVYKRGAFYYHAWTRLYVGTWVEVDPTWGETSLNVGHVEISSGSLDNLSMARMNLATGRTIGSLQLQIKDWNPH